MTPIQTKLKTRKGVNGARTERRVGVTQSHTHTNLPLGVTIVTLGHENEKRRGQAWKEIEKSEIN